MRGGFRTMTDGTVTNKFGDWIKEGFDLYKDNLGVLIVASLIAVLLSGVTCGILLGPMAAGLILMVLRFKDGEQPAPTVGDLFNGFRFFLQSFLFFLVWGLLLVIATLILMWIPCIGQLAIVCLYLAAGTFLMFALFLIVDDDMDFWTASMTSFTKAKEAFFPFLGLTVVAGILGQIGGIICGIGVFITIPLYYTILGVTYRDVFGGEEAAERVQIERDQASASETSAGPEGDR